ncbi:M35 family metallopeptidase [[Kitasatospora] papulosa]|uniref:M35 family metallopeptidase n=1 Tax=[Kitasatospora] papulosa TaxID=1464011 RepID=UPI0037F8E783
MISFEIHNVSDTAYGILIWDTPLHDTPSNFLSVNYEGSELRYEGPMCKWGEPSDEAYIILAPRESRSAEIDISKVYAIQRPGEYAVTLESELPDAYPLADRASSIARNRASHQRLALERVTATITVEPGDSPRMTLGQEIRLREAGQEPPDVATREPFMPWLIGGTASQQADVRAAHAHAVYEVGRSLEVLGYFGPANGYYKTWFGNNVAWDPIIAPGVTTYNITVSHFQAIKNIMNFGTFPVQTYVLSPPGQYCNSNKFAYTVGGTRTVWLCQLFWNASLYGIPDSKYGTLIHEWSHNAASTEDYEYGVATCKALAGLNCKRAVWNADNHEYFAEFL